MEQSRVIVYTSNGCSYCSQVIDFLKDLDIQPEERNISQNERYYEEWKQINPAGTPLTCCGDQHVTGFEREKLKNLIGASN